MFVVFRCKYRYNSDFFARRQMTKVSVKSHQLKFIFLFIKDLRLIVHREKSRCVGKLSSNVYQQEYAPAASRPSFFLLLPILRSSRPMSWFLAVDRL